MHANKRIFVLIGILSIFLANCGGPPPPVPASSIGVPPPLSWETLDDYDFNVAEADSGLQIPARHLYEWMYFSRVASAGGPVGDSIIQFFRDSVLVDTLFGLTTKDFDLSAHWYHFREYRDRTNAALRQAFWNREVSDKITIDSQTVVDYYTNHPEAFSLPEQVNVYHILSSPLGFLQGPDSALVDHYTREDLTAFSEEFIYRLYQLLCYGEAFENVAFNYSHDVLSRENGGKLGWTTRARYVDPFDSVAFSLEDGQFSKPYRDSDGWHILYREAYNPGGVQSLDTAWVYVKALQAVFDIEAGQVASRILDSLHRDTDFIINELVLSDTVIYLIDDTVWAAVVNMTDTIDVLRLKGLEEGFRRGYGVSNTNAEMRRNMITQAAQSIRVVQAARALGLDTLPDQKAIRSRVWHETVKALRLTEMYSRTEWEPSDSAIERYYEEHHADYNPENHIKARQLIVQDIELANFLREQIDLGLDLEYLADYYGGEEGYDVKFEDLGIVKRGEIDSILYYALENTHAYRTTRVIATDQGYHVAKVLQRDYRRPLEMVRGEIRSLLVEEYRWQRWADRRDQLFRQHHVRFPGTLPPFELPSLSERNHPRTLPKPVNVGR